MHHNSFWWGVNVGDYLIHGIHIKSVGGVFGICIFLALLSFLFEYLRFLQTKQRQKVLKLRAKQIRMLCSTESSALLAERVTDLKNPLNITLYDRSLLFLGEVFYWLDLQFLGYLLMLSVMLYDGWFLIAVVVGGGVGYFIFGHQFMKINLQNCQIIRQAYCTQICGDIDSGKRDGESTPAAEQPSTSTLSCHAQPENTEICSEQQTVTANVHSESH